MRSADRSIELLTALVADKQSLVDAIVAKGETASMSDSFGTLVEKVANLTGETITVEEWDGKVSYEGG